jgi:hypothetical protein
MAIKKYKNAEDILEQAINNVALDREALMDLMIRLREEVENVASPTTEISASQSMVKYVEGLIKANDQLIKAAAILKNKKEDAPPSNDLTEEDKKSFFSKD